MVACASKNEAAALLLMEATQKAGVLDVQVNVVWSVCWEGGWAGGGGRGGEGGRGGHKVTKGWGGALTHACTFLQGGYENNSALLYAVKYGWESAVAKLLSLGADAGLRDKVRACSYMNTCKCSVHVCMFVNLLLIRISLYITPYFYYCV